MPLAVVAVGGNAMLRLRAGDGGGVDTALDEAAAAVARLAADGWDAVLTHGNGPQVGELLELLEAVSPGRPPALDVLDAHTQGWLGYRLQRAVTNALRGHGLRRAVATILTTVVVDEADPDFAAPSKPVGPFYEAAAVEELRRTGGFQLVEDAGRGWRRVVPSPTPREVLEAPLIRALVESGAIVVAGGGGGIPVVRGPDGALRGVEAVIDKDRTSALLARVLGADVLLILTGVPEVRLDFGGPGERPLSRLTLEDAERLLAQGEFPSGSMGPKVEAAAEFVRATGRKVVITSPARAIDALRGEAGTTVLTAPEASRTT